MSNFKRALRNTVLFVLIVAILALAVPVYYYEYETSAPVDSSDVSERNGYAGTLNLLFTGASYGLRGCDPAVFDQVYGSNSYNLCGALFTMKGRYALLAEEIARNPVDTVIIELSAFSLSRDRREEVAEGDINVLERLITRQARLAWIADNFSLSELGTLYHHASYRGLNLLQRQLSAALAGQETPTYPGTRGFGGLETHDQTLTAEEYAAAYHTSTLDETIQPDNLEYLEKIFQLCEERGITVVMIATPISRSFINEYDNLDAIYQQYQDIAQAHNCLFLDFNLYKEKAELFPEDTAYYDSKHLSISGSVTFSQLLAQTLLDYQSGQDLSDRFYTSYLDTE